MSTYNNDDSYDTTGRRGAPSSADDSFANTSGGFGNESRGNTTSAQGIGGTGTFDDQDSGAYGGSSTQESRGFNTGNSVSYIHITCLDCS